MPGQQAQGNPTVLWGESNQGWAGRIVQVHNLPQNKIPDLDLARQLVKEEDFEMLELLFQERPLFFPAYPDCVYTIRGAAGLCYLTFRQ